MIRFDKTVVEQHSPSRGLPSSEIRLRLLCLFTQSCCTIRVLFTHGPSVGQILGPVNDNDQRADNRAIYCHVRVDAGRVLAHVEAQSRRHGRGGSLSSNLRCIPRRHARDIAIVRGGSRQASAEQLKLEPFGLFTIGPF